MSNSITDSKKLTESGHDDAGAKWADQAIAVAENFSFRPLESMNCLAINVGHHAAQDKFQKHFDSFHLLNTSTGELKSNLDEHCRADGDDVIIGLPDNSVDIVICPLSHINNVAHETLLNEIYRVLKYDGFCYIQAKRTGPFSLRAYKAITSYFWRHDYTSMLYSFPASFHAEHLIKPDNLISKLPPFLLSWVYRFLPFWVWILTKRK